MSKRLVPTNKQQQNFNYKSKKVL